MPSRLTRWLAASATAALLLTPALGAHAATPHGTHKKASRTNKHGAHTHPHTAGTARKPTTRHGRQAGHAAAAIAPATGLAAAGVAAAAEGHASLEHDEAGNPIGNTAAPAAGGAANDGARATPAVYAGEGRISYYHARFAGRRTANGERYDPQALTMAHRQLPLGTLVRVTNLRNQRSVVLRVNDRGPWVRGRIADVTQAAAARLDFLRNGVAKVRLEVLGRAAPRRVGLDVRPAGEERPLPEAEERPPQQAGTAPAAAAQDVAAAQS